MFLFFSVSCIWDDDGINRFLYNMILEDQSRVCSLSYVGLDNENEQCDWRGMEREKGQTKKNMKQGTVLVQLEMEIMNTDRKEESYHIIEQKRLLTKHCFYDK